MKRFSKSKVATVLIVLATVILAGVAIFTAIRLYQLRQEPVAPNVPSSVPKAETTTSNNCALTFTISAATPTGTATATPTATPTDTSTPTGTPNSCNGTCGSNSNCASNYSCYNGYCRNPNCPTETDCSCPGSTTASPTSTEASLPQSGTNWPTLFGAGLGTLVILGAILLAL